MSVETILLDFSIEPDRLSDDAGILDHVQILQRSLEVFFPNLKLIFETLTDDGRFCVFTEQSGVQLNVRLFKQGIITINVDYYKEENKRQRITFDLTREIRSQLEKDLDGHCHAYPAIHRGRINKYFPSSDERILEYDIDKILFDDRSPFQKVQIVHSKSLGNMLVLDELQNISEADLIYTESLMRRGVENYEGKEICILGGGDGALLYELLKENPKHIVMLEIDEVVMNACNKYLRSICGDVLEVRKTEQYEIIVGDCMVYIEKYINEGRKFDYVFGDLTDIPISDTPTGEVWNFIRSILEKSFQILKPSGKYFTHGNGINCVESLKMFEDQLEKMAPKVNFTRTNAFVPSFMEDWVFYQVVAADV